MGSSFTLGWMLHVVLEALREVHAQRTFEALTLTLCALLSTPLLDSSLALRLDAIAGCGNPAFSFRALFVVVCFSRTGRRLRGGAGGAAALCAACSGGFFFPRTSVSAPCFVFSFSGTA